MNKLFANKKFLGITSLVLATSMVVGTIAIRRSKNSKGIEVGVPQVLADSNYLDYDSSSQVNYSTVLGRAVDYGILSKNLNQMNHMQTTFATSLYTGGSDSCDANLGGPAAAQFIVAEMTEGSKLRFADDVYGQQMNYVVDTTYELANASPKKIEAVANTINVLTRKYDKDVLNQNIDSMIEHIQDESRTLVAKPAITVDDVLIQSPNNPELYTLDLDDDSYEGATVYFNVPEGSALLTAMGDNLTIKKRNSTVIVFNVLSNSSVTLKKFFVEVDGEKKSTNTDWDRPLNDQNTFVDEKIARKIIWNMPNATDVTLNSTAGVFLVPTPSAVVRTDGGPSAGWIACAGTTTLNKGIEFHFV
jgi:choice-of-anchor A domain-containing protein